MSTRTFIRRCAGAIYLCVSLLSLPVAGAGGVSFNRDVRPILADRCFACHGPDANERKGSLRLDQAEGDEGAYRTHRGSTAIRPGSVDDSELWYRVTTRDVDEVMPPVNAHKEPLTEEEQDVIKRWIEAGAPYENFWAFVPAKVSALPEVEDGEWSQLALDRYVKRRLEAQGLKPSAAADKRTLIRRVTFDLTGLPPTAEEVRTFLQDDSPRAYEGLIERLLASPAYGEHMTRYWLDLVRFADTNGMHKDFYRNLIAYRDWVIRAFNDNLGYDDFVRYQLAGDLYPDASNDQPHRLRVQSPPSHHRPGHCTPRGEFLQERPRSHHGRQHCFFRTDGAMCQLSRSQVRPDYAEGFLLAVCVLQQHRCPTRDRGAAEGWLATAIPHPRVR